MGKNHVVTVRWGKSRKLFDIPNDRIPRIKEMSQRHLVPFVFPSLGYTDARSLKHRSTKESHEEFVNLELSTLTDRILRTRLLLDTDNGSSRECV